MKKLFLTSSCACLLASCALGWTNITPPTSTGETTEVLTTAIETTTEDDTTSVPSNIKRETVSKPSETQVTPPSITQPSVTQPILPPTATTYTSSDVAKHGTASDCWLILSGGIYDVTAYIPRHPGGNKIVRGCGKDATQMFAKHPESAKAMKEQFKIGELAQ